MPLASCPRPLTLALVLAISALTLSGCATAPAATTTTGTQAAAAPPTPITKTLQVSNTLATPAVVNAGPAAEPTATETVDIEVPAGYTHLAAELKATCANPDCGYGLSSWRDGQAPDFDPSGSIDVGVAAGTYHLAARSTGPAAQMTGTITVVLT
ncbi:MAG: hypothetical protein QOI63_266 [Thermoplasmata archaeon]|jgi:hypothetical protein|nr:hypothetical protein [Thermoplasmata archaeon]